LLAIYFFCLDTKESNKEKIKKEKIYNTFLSFALIKLQYYCDFNCYALMSIQTSSVNLISYAPLF